MSRPRLFLLLLALSFFFAGLADAFVSTPQSPNSIVAFVHTFFIAALVYLWCKADAAERRTPPPAGAPLFAALLPPLGVPVYFFRSRPLRPALVATALALVFLVLLVSLSVAATLLAEQFRPAAQAG